MLFQPLTEKDLPNLMLIEEAAHLVPWTEEVFLRCFSAGYHCWGLEFADHLVGFVIFSIQVGECHILNVCVHPQYQGQGFGLQLMTYALTEAHKLGAEIAYLEVRRSNKNALKLYKKMGFIKIGERRGYYPADTETGREDGLVLAKDLSIR